MAGIPARSLRVPAIAPPPFGRFWHEKKPAKPAKTCQPADGRYRQLGSCDDVKDQGRHPNPFSDGAASTKGQSTQVIDEVKEDL